MQRPRRGRSAGRLVYFNATFRICPHAGGEGPDKLAILARMAQWHSLWLSDPLPPPVEREVDVERILTLSKHQPVAAAAYAFNSVLLAFFLWPITNHAVLLGWLALLWSVAALQLWRWLRNRRRRFPVPAPGRRTRSDRRPRWSRS